MIIAQRGISASLNTLKSACSYNNEIKLANGVMSLWRKKRERGGQGIRSWRVQKKIERFFHDSGMRSLLRVFRVAPKKGEEISQFQNRLKRGVSYLITLFSQEVKKTYSEDVEEILFNAEKFISLLRVAQKRDFVLYITQCFSQEVEEKYGKNVQAVTIDALKTVDSINRYSKELRRCIPEDWDPKAWVYRAQNVKEYITSHPSTLPMVKKYIRRSPLRVKTMLDGYAPPF